MASVYTDLATSQLAARTDYSQAPNTKQYGGRSAFSKHKTGYTAATADPLYVCRLRTRCSSDSAVVSIDYGDPGDACTGKIGYFSAGDTLPLSMTMLTLQSCAGWFCGPHRVRRWHRRLCIPDSRPVLVRTWIGLHLDDRDEQRFPQTWNIAYTVD